jgi:hypothetical protein
MTQPEIQECNKQIALMLGWKEHKLENNWFWGKKEMTYYKGFDKVNWSTPRVYIKYFKFHSNWNWLMEAVEFIEKLGYESLLGGSEYYYPEKGMRYIKSFIKDDINIFQESKDKKEATFIAVSDFAKLYNNKEL